LNYFLKRLHDRGKYEGSGLGLAIVKLMVEKLKGQIKIESTLGEGSKFIVTLPIHQSIKAETNAKITHLN